MASIYAACYEPTYFRKAQDTCMGSSSLATLEVARNCRNFHCVRSRVFILFPSLIFINSRSRQNKHTLLTSMLCSSVVKARYRDRQRPVMSKYVKNSISKNWSNVCILTSSTTYAVVGIYAYPVLPAPGQYHHRQGVRASMPD